MVAPELSMIYKYDLETLRRKALRKLKSSVNDRSIVFQHLSDNDAGIVIERAAQIFKAAINSTKPPDEWYYFDSLNLLFLERNMPEQLENESEYVYQRFQETKCLDFAPEFGLNKYGVIKFIMYYTLKTRNAGNTDFNYFCKLLSIDEATYNLVKQALSVETSANDVAERLKDAMCRTVDLYVLLIMAIAEAAKWSLKLDWTLNTAWENELSINDLKKYYNILHQQAGSALKKFKLNGKSSFYTDIIKNLQQVTLDAENKLKEVQLDIDKLSNTSIVSLVEERVAAVEKRHEMIKKAIPSNIMSHKNYSTEELTHANNNLNDIRKESAALSRSSSSRSLREDSTISFRQKLDLKNGQNCLARRLNSSYYFSYAKVVSRQTSTSYIVQFLDDLTYETVSLSDVANSELPLFDPCLGVNINRFIGMRVAALITLKNRGGAKWMSGTIGGFGGLHKNSFLVFFDRHVDKYIDAVCTFEDPRAQDYLNSNNPKQAESLLMFPLCKQSFNPTGLDLNRSSVYELIDDNQEVRTFVHRFFSKYPDWPLVKMRRPAMGSIPQSVVMSDRKIGFILDVDRAMCLLRFPCDDQPGADCYLHPCPNDGHKHNDEWLYRGSTRFSSLNIGTMENVNLSNRQKKLRQALYEDETSLNIARKSGILSGAKTVTNLIDKEELVRLKAKADKFKVVNILINSSEPKKYVSHGPCTKSCLNGLDKNPYDLCFKAISPLSIPLQCGWRRTVSTLSHRGRCLQNNRYAKISIHYTGPCGIVFRSMKDIGKYLQDTDSQLTVNLFNFNTNIDILRVIEVEKGAVVDEDYSQGQETFPIPAVNTVDDERPPKPPQFQYCARKYPLNDKVNLSTISKEFCSGCSCEDDCSNSDNCECRRLTNSCINRLAQSFRPQTYGYDYRLLTGRAYSGIFECNENCSCNSTKCWNRVVQNEISFPLQLFKTAGCGWGVRAVCDIPCGSFIANYVGAIMTDQQADQKGKTDDQYFADLDLNDVVENEKLQAELRLGHLDLGFGEGDEPEKNDDQNIPGSETDSGTEEDLPLKKLKIKRYSEEEEKRKKLDLKKLKDRENAIENQAPIFKWADYFNGCGEEAGTELFVLDAKYKGNIGRFLNHSCDPNVYVQHVLVDTHDLRLPWCSFFARKDIKAGEELCWNYGYNIDDNRPEELQVMCHCGARNCRGRLL